MPITLPSASRTLISLCSLALVLVACGGKTVVEEQKPVAPPTPEQVKSAALGVLEQYEQGYEVLSPAALESLYLEQGDVVVVVQGRAYRGWSQIEPYLTDLLTKASEVRLDLENVTVFTLGDDAAEVSAEVRREIKSGSTTVTERGVLTLTLSRFDDRWFIRAEHFSY